MDKDDELLTNFGFGFGFFFLYINISYYYYLGVRVDAVFISSYGLFFSSFFSSLSVCICYPPPPLFASLLSFSM